MGNLTGEYILNLKRDLLTNNEFLLSNSSIFNPCIVKVSTDNVALFLDASNRFVPYLVRYYNNPFIEVPIEDYLQEIWYVEPIINGNAVITDPYDYEVNGQTLSMVILSIPVRADNTVIGIVSVDFSLSFLNTLVAQNAPEQVSSV